MIAFSTAYRDRTRTQDLVVGRTQLLDRRLTPLFGAAIEVTEEAILNALFMATQMVGRDNHIAESLPLESIQKLKDIF